MDRRASTTWRDAVGEKRAAQVGLVFGKLLPRATSASRSPGKKAHTLDAARIAELGTFVETSMKLTGVPGVSVGIVQDGKVVFAGGFGVRELGKPAKVDADTRYMIASNTKAMATLMLAKLVDEKKLTWDTPATKALPTLQARRRRDHEPGADQAPHLRLHRHAAAGPRVAARVQGVTPATR